MKRNSKVKGKYSIVIPVYNSETIVSKTVDEILKETNKNNLDIEILLINDGSPDNSWKIIKNLAQEYKEAKSINLIKNFGQHNVALCGFENATGDYVIIMDNDLQNPQSEIIHLVNKKAEKSLYEGRCNQIPKYIKGFEFSNQKVNF